MDEDWRNAFGILMCDGAGAGICDGLPLTCSSFYNCHVYRNSCNKSKQCRSDATFCGV